MYSEEITYEEVDHDSTCVKDDIEKVLFEGLRYCSGDDSSLRHCREIGDTVK